jgi:hypothetical protein
MHIFHESWPDLVFLWQFLADMIDIKPEEVLAWFGVVFRFAFIQLELKLYEKQEEQLFLYYSGEPSELTNLQIIYFPVLYMSKIDMHVIFAHRTAHDIKSVLKNIFVLHVQQSKAKIIIRGT